jgi:hypothetical protein
MNPQERSRLIREQTLRIIDDCAGYMLPETRLIESLQAAVMPPPTQADCKHEIVWLESNGFIVGITPELGGPAKYKLTDKGTASL